MISAESSTKKPVEFVVTLHRRVLADYIELTKPRIASMALVTVAVGYLLGATDSFNIITLFHTLVGATLVAAGGSALNQWLEITCDSRMQRTQNRPLPSGRVSAIEALIFGLGTATFGLIYLSLTLSNMFPAVLAALTFVLYVAVYTPLKRVTVWNTVIGAVPGALPPLIGYSAATGELALDGISIFAIIFVWQIPHFLAIAWMYRDDYERGGMVMLPSIDHYQGRLTAWTSVVSTVLLIAVATLPAMSMSRFPASLYLLGSGVAGGWFLAKTLTFTRFPAITTARGVLIGSLIYLMVVMALIVGLVIANRIV